MLIRRLAIAALLVTAGCTEGPKASADGRGITPETHDALFPIASTDGGVHNVGTANVPDCASCHVNPDTFKTVSCVDCHRHDQVKTDATHLTVVPGYVFGPRTCLQCHPTGRAGAFDHSARFPIAKGDVHQAVACSDCHTDPTNRKAFECTACHIETRSSSLASDMKARHTLVPGYAWSSPSCYQCHPDAKVPLDAVDHSTKFPIGAGSKHAGVSCGTCHTDPNDRKVFDCTTCHTAATTTPNHAGIGGYQWSSPSCYGCHPQANAVGTNFTHTKFPIAAGARHAGISCSTCHTVPGDRSVFDCLSCHPNATTTPRHTGVPNYLWKSTSCYGCHPQANVVGLVNHAPLFPITGAAKHANIACASCHVDAANRKNVSCANACHPSAAMTTEHVPVGGYSYSSPLCYRCHSDADVHLVAQHLPFGITSNYKHYRKSCLSCHPAARTDKPNPPIAADFDLGTATLFATGSCGGSGCHSKTEMDGQHQGRANYSYTPFSTCLQSGCHNDGRK